ncbi:MAG: hypothetical protein D3913_16850, partial [Candidatus Electrothrix sp. LOE1_4_5]|nr:hypothetical protein [Candidatus Electrothrix gigas]
NRAELIKNDARLCLYFLSKIIKNLITLDRLVVIESTIDFLIVQKSENFVSGSDLNISIS